jgi:DNA-directed RNA polymerase specialized sigma subunit
LPPVEFENPNPARPPITIRNSSPLRHLSHSDQQRSIVRAADLTTFLRWFPRRRAEYLTEMRKKAGLTQAEVAEAMGVSQQRVSAIESGAVAELATLGDYTRALGG